MCDIFIVIKFWRSITFQLVWLDWTVWSIDNTSIFEYLMFKCSNVQNVCVVWLSFNLQNGAILHSEFDRRMTDVLIVTPKILEQLQRKSTHSTKKFIAAPIAEDIRSLHSTHWKQTGHTHKQWYINKTNKNQETKVINQSNNQPLIKQINKHHHSSSVLRVFTFQVNRVQSTE